LHLGRKNSAILPKGYSYTVVIIHAGYLLKVLWLLMYKFAIIGHYIYIKLLPDRYI